MSTLELETLEGYLERLRIANYYEQVGWYRHAIGPDMSLSLRLLRKEAELAALGSLTRLSVQEVYARTLHSLVPCFYTQDEVAAIMADPRNQEHGDVDAPLWPHGGINLYVHTTTKVCPECWREQRTTYLPWMLRPVTTCPRHNLLLLERCPHPGCGAALVLSMAQGRSKGCLHDLATMPAESVADDPYGVELARLMWASLRPDSGPRSNPAHYERIGLEWLPQGLVLSLPATSPILGMTAADMHQFFHRMGKALLPYGSVLGLSGTAATLVSDRAVSKLRSTNNVERHELYLRIWRVLRDWEHEWPALLARIAAYEQPIVASKKIETFPGRLVDEFPHERWRWLHDSWMAFTKEQAFRSDSVRHWLFHYRFVERDGLLPSSSPTSSPTPVTTLTTGAVPSKPGQRAYSPSLLTMPEVAGELGLSPVATKMLVDRGTFARVVRVDGGARGMKLVLVDGDEVREYARLRGPVLTLRETCEYLGVSTPVVTDMVKEGMLHAESEPRRGKGDGMVWRFRRAELDGLVESVIGPLPLCAHMCAEGKGDGTRACGDADLLTIYQAVSMKGLRRITIPQLLRAVMSGALVACRAAGTDLSAEEGGGATLPEQAGVRLQDLRLERASVRSLLEEPVDGLVTRNQTIRSIRCHFSALPLLKAARLLVPAAGDPGVPTTWRYRQADIEDYLDRYIDGDAAAVLIGVRVATLYKWVREGSLQAASNPHVDPYPEYRFDRHALLAWRRERLTAGEASAMLGVSTSRLAQFARGGLVRILSETNDHSAPRTSARWYSRADVEALRASLSSAPSE
ncbi:MAG: helix-turn-helix domain-containing protein [Chloroflexota bacterium]|nr:helix-turn-helix domain-containing protein [Chloroflexota bacterium]